MNLRILFCAILFVLAACGEQGPTPFVGLAPQTCSNTSASLSWQPPTHRTDGTPLANGELYGFKIHFGPSSRNYTDSITVANPVATTYKVENLNPNQEYYFAMTAHDNQMRSSTYSNEVTKDMKAVSCPRAIRRVMTNAIVKENKNCSQAVTLKYFWEDSTNGTYHLAFGLSRGQLDQTFKIPVGQNEFSLEVDREQLAYAKLIKMDGEKIQHESGEFLYKVLSCEELEKQRERNPNFKENFDIKLAL